MNAERGAAVLLVACVAAVAVALAGTTERAHAEEATAQAPDKTVGAPLVHGLAPMPGGAPVPQAYRPPGSYAGDRGPSHVIFPAQKLTIRFNHKRHVRELGMSCVTCHDQAKTSRKSSDSLLPPAKRCDGCHLTDHRDLDAVTGAPGELIAQCRFCHVGYQPEHGNRVARQVVPKPNLRFNHAVHAARNIACQQCHGTVQNLELATRDQLPRMRRCLDCHDKPEAARGEAKSACTTCHLSEADGVMKTSFATGRLEPPSWLRNAGHDADWLERHKRVAADDSQLCANCHHEDECVDCHDGRVRPRNVHPNDWISMHAVAARQNNPSCTSCHQIQSFCVSCHQRVGVTLSGPTSNLAGRGQFHPPKSEWTDPPRTRSHHAWEAQRNLNACVSCHVERDCAVCHATAAVGGRGGRIGGSIGQGSNPHPAGFRARCRTALRKNARPCLVCHDPQDSKLAECR